MFKRVLFQSVSSDDVLTRSLPFSFPSYFIDAIKTSKFYSKNLWFVVFLFLLAGLRTTVAQTVSVDLSTGLAHASVPVSVVRNGTVAVPVSLEYSAGGVRVDAMQSVLGTGWQLNAGGFIVRELRDLPDDIKTDQASNSRMGWMYNNNVTKINSFTIANDNNVSTCTDETTDINYMTANFNDASDLEPDVFFVSAPGLSCQLIYDRINNVFRTVPFRDYQVTYTLNAAQNSIISFTIVNDQGVTYQFATTEPVTETTNTPYSGGIKVFKRKYDLFVNGIVYNQKWCLSKIIDPNGNYITLTYATPVLRSVVSPRSISQANGPGSWAKINLYNINQSYHPQCIASISSYSKVAGTLVDVTNFNYTTTTDASGVLLSNIQINQGKRTLYCTYSKVTGKNRDWLTSFGEPGCIAGGVNYNANLYQFQYTNITFPTAAPAIVDFSTNGNQQDAWGFPNSGVDGGGPLVYVYPDNPSYPNLERYRIYPIAGYPGTVYTVYGEDKTVSVSEVGNGTLSQITYPTGGTTSLLYEPNDYYDVSAAAVFKGGGVRIKQITDYDGISTANNMVKNYYYTTNSLPSGTSSGKPISLPAVAFTQPYNGGATGQAYWNYSTVRLFQSESNQDETIIYGKVTVQQTGAGTVVNEFSTPATFWDASANPVAGGATDWTPSISNMGRLISGGSCPSIGSTKNAKFSYPFPPNINYDFERSLPLKTSTYNESGTLVSQKTFNYARSYATPIGIPGLRSDYDSNALAYTKYQLYTTTSELLSVETSFLNDLATNDPAKRLTTTTNYFYLSTLHKLPTKIERVNTDGSINRTYIKYIKDYFWNATDVDPVKYMAAQNENFPAEKYNTVVRGGTEKTFSAELTRFGYFASGVASPANNYLPSQTLKFISATGVTDFAFSSGYMGTWTSYSGYVPVANYTAYNNAGFLLSSNDNFKNVSSRFIDELTLLPVAQIKNADYKEAVYSNFDGIDGKYGFTATGCTLNTIAARTGVNSMTVPTAGSLSATLNLKSNVKNYVFSTSVYTPGTGAGTLTISLYNGATLVSTQTLAFPASTSGWTYVERKMSTTGLASSFTIKVQTNVQVCLDDVLFYPDNAEVYTYAYDPKTFMKTGEVNTNGVATNYWYDQYYRLTNVFDQDNNIVLKKTYASYNTIASGLTSVSFLTSPTSGILYNTSVNFTGSAAGSCVPGIYYSWDFGDGGTSPASLTNTAAHSFTYSGNYNVALTVSNPVYGTKSSSQIVPVLFTVQGCQSGVSAYYGGHIYTFTCSGHTSDTTHSYFWINSTPGIAPGHTVSYQWQIKYQTTGANCGSTSWTNTGTNASSFTKSFSTSTFCPYFIQCIVTDTNTGIQITSQQFEVDASPL